MPPVKGQLSSNLQILLMLIFLALMLLVVLQFGGKFVPNFPSIFG